MNTLKKAMISICLLITAFPLFAQESEKAEKKKIYMGAEGGVVFNTGYSFVNIPDIGYSKGGVPLGVGGRGFVLLGNHCRVGGEGYMNTIELDNKGSECIYAFGGAMADFCWRFDKVLTYVGSNIGGGILKTFYSTEKQHESWQKVDAYFDKRFVWAAHPYAGIQVKVASRMSLIFQLSYTLPLNPSTCRGFNGINVSIGLEFGN